MRPVAFGMGAILKYENAKGKGVLSLITDFGSGRGTFSDLLFLLVCALENGAKKAGQFEAFKVEQVAEWLDDHPEPGKVIGGIMLSLAASMPKEEDMVDNAKKNGLVTYPEEQTSTT